MAASLFGGFPSSSFGRLAGFFALLCLAASSANAAISNGNYGALRTAANTSLCVDATNNDARVVSCNNTNAQRFQLQSRGDWYVLRSQSSNQCLVVEGASRSAGARVVQAPCSNAANERLTPRVTGFGIALAMSHSSLCVTASGTASGVGLSQQPCAEAAVQAFNFEAAMWPSAPFQLASNGLCIDVWIANTSNGAEAALWGCNGTSNQRFRMVPLTNGVFELRAEHSNRCLDIAGRSTASGAKVIQWDCLGATNQYFYPRIVGDGYAWVAVHSGQCIALESVSGTSGTRLVQRSCDASAAQTWKRDGQSIASRWTDPMPISIVPAAAAVLPNGKVLAWSAWDRLNYLNPNGAGYTYTTVIDPTTGVGTETLVTNTGHDMFCPGIANLGDGGVHVTGGSSAANTSVYNWINNTWSRSSAMNVPRGYQGAATMSSGEVFTVGGSWNGGSANKIGEVWSPSTGYWRRLDSVRTEAMQTADSGGGSRADNHMWLFADSNGRMFHAGPARTMRWISTVGTGIQGVGIPRGDDADGMNGNATMFAPREILVTGGALDYNSGPSRSSAYRIAIGGDSATTTKLAPMAYQRAMHSSVALPTGEVLAVGGQSAVLLFSDYRAVLVPEIWSPATNTFLPLAPMSIPRTYHSVALLLPDGRVMAGGGGLCGTCTDNHPNIEIFSPPYLLNPDFTEARRPSIFSAPGNARVGSTISVKAHNSVARFEMVRVSSITHTVNNEQRRVPTQIVDSSVADAATNNFSVRLNADSGVLLPGYWMLFAFDGAGRLSESKMIRVDL